METVLEKDAVLRGGEFLIRESSPESIFIPEDADEDQKMIRQMVMDFIDTEITPNTARIEEKEEGLAPSLVEKLGELGILGAHMPEEYGGLNLHTNTNTMVAESMGYAGSFCVTFAAHTGIGMLPIYYFGTDAQKEKYLPKLISGEWKACYCLTEPGSGSDALAAKTRADLSADGKTYTLNGNKMWITNSGFADVFIVFAKIDGDKFTGFIVDRNAPGLNLGGEEEKLGIHGSSTRQVFLENCVVPSENVLGEIGKGHLIAFNVLNIGRFKLGAICIGGAKQNATLGIKYANERVQFKVPISSFGAIQYKIAEQVIRIFALESAEYRVSDMIQDKINSLKTDGHHLYASKLSAAEEFSVECAMLKVLGSETLDYVVDETLQIHGGNGFSEEYKAAKAYRDSRINRIYEGTNEINRLLSVDQLLRRAMSGALDLTTAAWAVQKELASVPSMTTPEGPYGREIEAVKNLKKCVLMVAGSAVKQQMEGALNLKTEQELLMNIADMMQAVFTAESTLLRVQKLAARHSESEMEVYNAIMRVHLHDCNANMRRWSEDAISSFATGDLLDILLRGAARFTKLKPVNAKDLRRVVAAKAIAADAYPL